MSGVLQAARTCDDQAVYCIEEMHQRVWLCHTFFLTIRAQLEAYIGIKGTAVSTPNFRLSQKQSKHKSLSKHAMLLVHQDAPQFHAMASFNLFLVLSG